MDSVRFTQLLFNLSSILLSLFIQLSIVLFNCFKIWAQPKNSYDLSIKVNSKVLTPLLLSFISQFIKHIIMN